jgi:hypothetical protein
MQKVAQPRRSGARGSAGVMSQNQVNAAPMSSIIHGNRQQLWPVRHFV